MQVPVRVAVLAALLCICWCGTASAASFDLLAPYLSGQYFTWREYSGGSRILRESGPIFAGGVVVGGVTDFSMTLRGKAEIFGGEVGYDGHTQAPSSEPISTDVTYVGTRQEFDLGYRAGSGGFSVEPFAGGGYRYWLRDLQDTTTSDGERVHGYTERWLTAYTRLGARGRYLDGTGVSFFAEGGAKYPLYTGNSVDFDGYGTTTFRPRGRWSAFGEVGADLHRVKVTVYYDSYRFEESPVKTVGDAFYYQPDSSSDIVGLSVGWSFR